MRKFVAWFKNRVLDEEKEAEKREAKELIDQLLETGGHECESLFVEGYKKIRPDASKEELLRLIKHFHAYVDEKKRRDSGLL